MFTLALFLVTLLTFGHSQIFQTTTSGQFQDQLITCPNGGDCYVNCTHTNGCQNTVIHCPNTIHNCYVSFGNGDMVTQNMNMGFNVTIKGFSSHIIMECLGHKQCSYKTVICSSNRYCNMTCIGDEACSYATYNENGPDTMFDLYSNGWTTNRNNIFNLISAKSFVSNVTGTFTLWLSTLNLHNVSYINLYCHYTPTIGSQVCSQNTFHNEFGEDLNFNIKARHGLFRSKVYLPINGVSNLQFDYYYSAGDVEFYGGYNSSIYIICDDPINIDINYQYACAYSCFFFDDINLLDLQIIGYNGFFDNTLQVFNANTVIIYGNEWKAMGGTTVNATNSNLLNITMTDSYGGENSKIYCPKYDFSNSVPRCNLIHGNENYRSFEAVDIYAVNGILDVNIINNYYTESSILNNAELWCGNNYQWYCPYGWDGNHYTCTDSDRNCSKWSLNPTMLPTSTPVAGNIYTTTYNGQYQDKVITCQDGLDCYVNCTHLNGCQNAVINCPNSNHNCYLSFGNGNLTTVNMKIGFNVTIEGSNSNVVVECLGHKQCSYITVVCPSNKDCNMTCKGDEACSYATYNQNGPDTKFHLFSNGWTTNRNNVFNLRSAQSFVTNITGTFTLWLSTLNLHNVSYINLYCHYTPTIGSQVCSQNEYHNEYGKNFHINIKARHGIFRSKVYLPINGYSNLKFDYYYAAGDVEFYGGYNSTIDLICDDPINIDINYQYACAYACFFFDDINTLNLQILGYNGFLDNNLQVYNANKVIIYGNEWKALSGTTVNASNSNLLNITMTDGYATQNSKIYCPSRNGYEKRCNLIQGNEDNRALREIDIYAKEGILDVNIINNYFSESSILFNAQLWCGDEFQYYCPFGWNGVDEYTCTDTVQNCSTLFTFEPSVSPTQYPTVFTVSPSKYPSDNPTANPTSDPSSMPTEMPSNNPTLLPTVNPSNNPSVNPSNEPTVYPTAIPTQNPSLLPSNNPTSNPTSNPTQNPSLNPTINPTNDPSINPTIFPTSDPSVNPSNQPTQNPLLVPSADPSINPTVFPTNDPSSNPTSNPTNDPSSNPTIFPTNDPSANPSSQPTQTPSLLPSENPSVNPSQNPSINPTQFPTTHPSANPTTQPSENPSSVPSNDPSVNPSHNPTQFPSINPTIQPSLNPSLVPSNNPSVNPTTNPSQNPTQFPSVNPSMQPTSNPSLVPSNNPSINPTTLPSINPSSQPTNTPTLNPSESPIKSPTTSDVQELEATLVYNFQVSSENTSDITEICDSYSSEIESSISIDNVNDVNISCTEYQSLTVESAIGIQMEITLIILSDEDLNEEAIIDTFNEDIETVDGIQFYEAVEEEITIENYKNSKNNSNPFGIEIIIVIAIVCLIPVIVYVSWLFYRNRKRNSENENKMNKNVELERVNSSDNTSPKTGIPGEIDGEEKNDTTIILKEENEKENEKEKSKSEDSNSKSGDLFTTHTVVQTEKDTPNTPENVKKEKNTNGNIVVTKTPQNDESVSMEFGTKGDTIASNNENEELGETQDLGNPKDWNNETVILWLNNIVNLGQYSDNFKENNINGEYLLKLTLDDLKNEIGVKSFGHRNDIIKFIQQLKD